MDVSKMTYRISDGRRIQVSEMYGNTPGIFGTDSLIVFLAMFGGSTFLLFLLCYCCQKKLREDTLSLDDGEMNDRSHLHQVHVISGSSVPSSQTYQTVPSSPSPPPAYDSVVKNKDPYIFNESPPPYEVAMANLRSGGYV